MVALDLNIRGGTTSHGKYGHILVHKYLVTGNVKTFDGDFDKDTADAATLGMDVEDNLPGIAKGMWKCDGVMSTQMERRMLPLKNRQSPIQCGSFPKGLAAGALADCMPASFGKYSKSYSKKDETGIKFELGARGAYNEGVISISPKAYLTGASGVGPVDDHTLFGGATSYGGAVYAWLHDVIGGTTPTVAFKLTNCATSGGTYTDVVGGAVPAMSMGTDAGEMQALYIPSTSAINIFTQIAWTATGSPTSFQATVVTCRSFDPSL